MNDFAADDAYRYHPVPGGAVGVVASTPARVTVDVNRRGARARGGEAPPLERHIGGRGWRGRRRVAALGARWAPESGVSDLAARYARRQPDRRAHDGRGGGGPDAACPRVRRGAVGL